MRCGENRASGALDVTGLPSMVSPSSKRGRTRERKRACRGSWKPDFFGRRCHFAREAANSPRVRCAHVGPLSEEGENTSRIGSRVNAISLLLAACLSLNAVASVAAEAIVEDLGSFLQPFYDKPEEKRITDDLEVFNGRIYIAYGYTNTKVPHQVIYYDLAKGAYARHEDADGRPLTWPIEKTYKTHRFGDELFILDYDPIHDDSNLLRVQKDGRIVTQYPSGDAHNRDVIVFDHTIFVSHGTLDVPWPSMRWSHDDGKTWQQIDQSKVSKRSLYERFFVFKNRLYACTNSKEWKEGTSARTKRTLEEIKASLVPTKDVPWLIRYTGDKTAPWEGVHMSPDAVLPHHPDGNSEYGEVIFHAEQGGDELVFESAGRLYCATSLDPPAVTPISLGVETRVTDFYRDGDGRVWILTGKRQEKKMVVQVLLFTGKASVRSMAEFEDTQGASCLTVVDGVAYLGYHGGHLKRVRVETEKGR